TGAAAKLDRRSRSWSPNGTMPTCEKFRRRKMQKSAPENLDPANNRSHWDRNVERADTARRIQSRGVDKLPVAAHAARPASAPRAEIHCGLPRSVAVPIEISRRPEVKQSRPPPPRLRSAQSPRR